MATKMTLLAAAEALIAGASQVSFPKDASAMVQFGANDWQNFIDATNDAQGNLAAGRKNAQTAAEDAADAAAQSYAANVALQRAQQEADDANARVAALKTKADALATTATDAQNAANTAAAAQTKAATTPPPVTSPTTPAPVVPPPVTPAPPPLFKQPT